MLFRQIYLHPSTIGFYGASENGIFLPADDPFNHFYSVLLSYQYYRSQTLPFPYSTNCYDYTKASHPATSRAHHFDRCVRKRFLKEWQRLPSSLVLHANMNYSLLFTNEFIDTEVAPNSTDFLRIQNHCKQMVSKRNCVNEIYVPNRLTTDKEKDGGNGGFVGLVAPGRPQIITTSKAKIESIDFITYILSCLSFWFAFSPLVILTEGVAYKFIQKKFLHGDVDNRKCDCSVKVKMLEQQVDLLYTRLGVVNYTN